MGAMNGARFIQALNDRFDQRQTRIVEALDLQLFNVDRIPKLVRRTTSAGSGDNLASAA